MKYIKRFNETKYKWENDYVDFHKVNDELNQILNTLGIFTYLEHNPPVMDNYIQISFCLGQSNSVENYSILRLIENGYKLQDSKKWILETSEEVYPLVSYGGEYDTISTVINKRINIELPNSNKKKPSEEDFLNKDCIDIFPENNEELYKTILEIIILIYKHMTDITTVIGNVLRTSKDLPLRRLRMGIIEYLNNALNKKIIIPKSLITYINKVIGIHPDRYNILTILAKKQPLLYQSLNIKGIEDGNKMGEMGF